MNCPRCGAPAPMGATNCTYCNTPLGGYPPQAPPYGPAAYPGVSPLLQRKTGADIAGGVLFILFGLLSLFVWGVTLVYFITEVLPYTTGYYSMVLGGGGTVVIYVALILCVIMVLSSLFLLISGIMACVNGRGNGLAITSAVLNLVIFLLVIASFIITAAQDDFGIIGSMLGQSWWVIALIFVFPLVVFIMLPVRSSVRRKAAFGAAGPMPMGPPMAPPMPGGAPYNAPMQNTPYGAPPPVSYGPAAQPPYVPYTNPGFIPVRNDDAPAPDNAALYPQDPYAPAPPQGPEL